MKRKMVIGMLTMGMVLCGAMTVSAESDGYVISASHGYGAVEHWEIKTIGMQDAAKDLGVEFNYKYADGDLQQEVADIENFVEMICGQLESDHRLSKYSLRDEKVKKTILKATGISKSFSHVPILKNVDFELDSAETHILMGENGAGKSTLMKIITGVYQQDKGNIYLDDGKGNLEEIAFSNPKMALEKGISMVFQEFNLMENMTIAENIFMGYEPVKKGLIDWNKMNQDALKWMEMVEIDAPPTELVENLSTAQKQCVEIAKCLSHNAKIIILDEPTSSLSEREVRTLFKLIAKLKKEGISIIYISHRMEVSFDG